MPSISYAGVPLVLENPGYEFQVWLERELSTRDLTLFGVEPPDIYQGRHRPRGPFLGGTFDVVDCSPNEPISCGMVHLPSVPFVGLPLPNYSVRRPPRWKINTLWFPTGATRWSIGLFLCDAASLARIIPVVRAGDGRAPLRIQEFRNGVAGTTMTLPSMFMLPPRELNNTESGVNGFLLCLVDQRWFWQFTDTGLLEVGEETTWPDVYDMIAEGMGVTVDYDDINPGYFRPDPEEVTRRYENGAMLLDAVAHSVGQRIVLGTNNVVRAMTPSTSAVINTANQALLLAKGLSAGGRHLTYRETVFPAAVRTIFPAEVDGVYPPDGNVYPKTIQIGAVAAQAANTYGFVSNTVKVLHTTAPAMFSSGDSLESIGLGTAVPLNQAFVDALATQIATDYYGWLAEHYDQAGVGLILWTPNGFDDYIHWNFAYQNRLPYGLEYQEGTRS